MIEIATNIWYMIFAIFFVLLLIATGIWTLRGEFPTQLFAILSLLQLVWVVPFILYIIVKYAPLLIASVLIIVLGLIVLVGIAWVSGSIQRKRNS